MDASGLPDLGELGREDLDAAGALVCEPFVDAHLHLDYANTVGQPANLILLDATDDKDAVWHQADVLASIRAGKVVFTAPRREVTWMA